MMLFSPLVEGPSKKGLFIYHENFEIIYVSFHKRNHVLKV